MKDIAVVKDGFCISTEMDKLDLAAVHKYLSKSAYWCLGIPKDRVEKAAKHSLNFGMYKDEEQIGYARIISDFSSIAYLGDVYVLEPHRGNGLSKWLMQIIMGHPELQGLRRWILLTGNAHELYKKYGWKEIENPDVWMEINDKDVYSENVNPV